MQFRRINPAGTLKDLIECYWIAKNDNPAPEIQKIIPDGFTEMIFHFGDPYQIKLKEQWQLQPRDLLAGQITSYFHLRNTGMSDMLGVKFKPAALTRLFDISMHTLTDRVVELKESLGGEALTLGMAIRSTEDAEKRISIIEEFLTRMLPIVATETSVEKALEYIFSARGSTRVAELCAVAGVQERQLERVFKKYVGLSPKLFARIIRFSTIFELVREKDIQGIELGLESGFYDQSHFIRNFKAFTGEDPSRYFFNQPNLANFFLKKGQRDK